MPHRTVTARAGANIAFIKYWGNREGGLNLPLNPSISMTLTRCVTETTVEILPDAQRDEILLDGRPPGVSALRRIGAFLDLVRERARRTERLKVTSANTFPSAAGIASSASGFAALALAAATVLDLSLDPVQMSRLARLGSGSAARSIMGGFVELHPSESDDGAYAEQVAGEDSWPDLRDLILILSESEKEVSSAVGHRLASTSEMFRARLQSVLARAELVRQAIRERDLEALGEAAEADALSMHAVMMTSRPPLIYWSGRTIEAIRTVWALRREGLPAWFTIDAGPNVHVLTAAETAPEVERHLADRLGARIIVDSAGPGAQIVEDRCR